MKDALGMCFFHRVFHEERGDRSAYNRLASISICVLSAMYGSGSAGTHGEKGQSIREKKCAKG